MRILCAFCCAECGTERSALGCAHNHLIPADLAFKPIPCASASLAGHAHHARVARRPSSS
eukprot:scaffold293380_cov13-Tisochrysis_lutea.AAC.1